MRQNGIGHEAQVAYLGLGSNLGDREDSLRAALQALNDTPGVEVTAVSSLYETAPIGVTEQPDFLNAAAAIRTTLPPGDLLEAVLRIENNLGRVRNKRWGPRVIDIDILLYGDRRIRSKALTVPHPRLRERPFALAPLAEIAPDAVLPGEAAGEKKTAREWAEIVCEGGNIPSRYCVIIKNKWVK